MTALDAPAPTGPGNVGDRLVGFSVLLPAVTGGGVLLATGASLADALAARYPGAHRHRAGGPLPPPGTTTLLVLDERTTSRAERRALLRTVAADGAVATVGRRGDLVVHPGLERPEQVRRRGWPRSAHRSAPAAVAREALRRSRAPRLSVRAAPGGSLADDLARDLGAHVGGTLRLAGVLTGEHTVLRFRGAGHDLAVRVSLLGDDDAVDRGAQVLAEVPAVAPWAEVPVASGRTAGLRWVATPWVPPVPARTHRRRADGVLAAVVDALATGTTGRTTDGWGRAWLAGAGLLDEPTRRALAPLLARLDDGLPTGWCHGDPWPGNVLLTPTGAVVTDWGNASPDAPRGLDQVLLAAFRRAATDGVDLATACARLVDADLVCQVAGRPWTAWDREDRAALAAAAAVLHLRNRSVLDLDGPDLAAYRTSLAALARASSFSSAPPAPPAPPMPPASPARGGGPTSGAGWLGVGAGVVKAAQTVVLLVLAALLAPSAIGVLAVGALVLNVSSAVTDLGTSTALVHWRGDAERAARSALTLALGLALVLTTGAWLAAPWLSAVLNSGDLGVQVVRGLVLCLPMHAVAGVSHELLRRDLAFRRRVLPDIAGGLVGALVSVSLAVAGAGALSLVAGQLVQAALVMVLSWAARPVRPGWRRADAGRLLAYGGGLAGAAVLQLLMLNVDYLLVAHRLGAEQLGIYSMAFRLGYMPYLLVGMVVAGAAFAHLCRMEGPDLARAVVDSTLRMFALLLPLYVGMILLAPQLALLGAQWAPGVPALRWLAAYGVALSLLGLLVVVLNAVARTRDGFLLTLLHLALLTALLLVWVDAGIERVAAAQLVAGAATLAVGTAILRRRVPGVPWGDLARRATPLAVGTAAMLACDLVLAALLPWPRVSVAGLLVVGTALLLAYLVPVVLLDRHRLLPLPGAERWRP